MSNLCVHYFKNVGKGHLTSICHILGTSLILLLLLMSHFRFTTGQLIGGVDVVLNEGSSDFFEMDPRYVYSIIDLIVFLRRDSLTVNCKRRGLYSNQLFGIHCLGEHLLDYGCDLFVKFIYINIAGDGDTIK